MLFDHFPASNAIYTSLFRSHRNAIYAISKTIQQKKRQR